MTIDQNRVNQGLFDTNNYYPLNGPTTLKVTGKENGQDTEKTLNFPIPWAKVSYTVAFNSMGGSAVASQKVNRGEKASKPEEPTRNGFVFQDWYTDRETTTLYDFGTEVKQNITLYAKWEPATTLSYTVKYVDKDTKAELANDKVVNGQTFNASVTEDAISIDGYTVVGDASKTITITAGTNEIVFEYAKRTDLSYTVKYVDKDTRAELASDKVVDGQTFNAKIGRASCREKV